MIVVVDEPKCLQDAAQCQARRDLLNRPSMRDLTVLVRRLRCAGRDVPDFDPLDGGVDAEVLFLLEAPGRRAVGSGFVSRNNPDETAQNWFLLNREAGIDRRRTITWNIVPWYIGENGRIRPATAGDIGAGLPYLRELLGLLPRLKMIVLVGRKAGRARASIQSWNGALEVMELAHPSPMFVNRAPHHRGQLRDGLVRVRERLDQIARS